VYASNNVALMFRIESFNFPPPVKRLVPSEPVDAIVMSVLSKVTSRTRVHAGCRSAHPIALGINTFRGFPAMVGPPTPPPPQFFFAHLGVLCLARWGCGGGG
jgi:hypothetical protein